MLDPSQRRPDPPGCFATTHWSVVLRARDGDSAVAGDALSQLCRVYWSPIHDYVRRRGYGAADAEDLTQEFFARFLAQRVYRVADRERGRFRSFLLGCLKNFLAKEWERASAQKRGGGMPTVSLDETLPGGAARSEPADELTADRIFERNWALALLQRARARLEAEYAGEGRAERFVWLEKFLPGAESEATYAEAARVLGTPEGTLRSDVHRLKRRYAALVRAEIAHTVSTPGELEEELRHLRLVLG